MARPPMETGAFTAADGSDPASLGWPAAVMGDWRHIPDSRDLKPHRLKGAQGRLAARARTLNLNLKRPHTVLLRLAPCVFCRDLRRVRRRFPRPLKAECTGRRPGNRVPLRIRNCDHRVVKRRVHMRHAGGNVLRNLTFGRRSFIACHALLLFLLASDRFRRALTGPRVGMRALPTNRQTTPMAQAAVAA